MRNRTFKLPFIPNKNVKDGILVKFDTDTRTTESTAVRDIIKGQQKYLYPIDDRKVIGIYQKIK